MRPFSHAIFDTYQMARYSMQNKTDFFFGLGIIIFTLVMGHQIYLLPPFTGVEFLSPASFPKAIVAILFILSCLLLIKSFRHKNTDASWPAKPILIRIGLMSVFVAAYVFGYIYLGEYAYAALWPEGISFAITTFLFLISSQYLAGNTKLISNVSVASIMTGASYSIFIFFFKVPLM